MKVIFYVLYTVFWFAFSMIREYVLLLFFQRTENGCVNNVKLLLEGGREYLSMVQKYEDMVVELSFKYLNILFETAY